MTHLQRPIRVLEICPGFAIEGRSGGVGQHVISLCRALNRVEVQPLICGLWHYGTQLEDDRLAALRAEGFMAFTASRWDGRLAFLNVYTAFRGMQAVLQKQPVDIIHSHAEFSDFAALWLRATSRTPVVMRTLHSREWGRRPFLRFWAKLLYPLAFDCEVGISPLVQQSLNARWLARVGRRQAKQINNAIPLARFSNPGPVDVPTLKASLGLPPDSLVVGSVGRLVVQKGYNLVLQAFVKVRQALPNAYLVLVGGGEQAEEFKALAHSLGLAQSVVFAGMRPDVPALLRCFDLFVLASWWEGLPTVIMEAMAAGVPVLGTDVSGTHDLIKHGDTGWLVPARSVPALEAGMLYGLQHLAEGQGLAARAKAVVEAYDIAIVAAQYESLYQTLLATKV